MKEPTKMPMAGYELNRLLEVWGIDIRKLRCVTIKIPFDDIVTITVEYIPDLDPEELTKTMSKEYAIVELKNE